MSNPPQLPPQGPHLPPGEGSGNQWARGQEHSAATWQQNPGSAGRLQWPSQPQAAPQQSYFGHSTGPQTEYRGNRHSHSSIQHAPSAERTSKSWRVIRIILIVVSVIGTVLAGLVAINLADRPVLPATAETPQPTSSASPTTEGSGNVGEHPDEVNKPPAKPDWLPDKTWLELPTPTGTTSKDQVVMSSWIYNYYVPIPRGCPAIETKPDKGQYQDLAQKLLDCVHDAWKLVFAHAGLDYSKPQIKIFDKKGSSPCGKISPDVPGFYCPEDETIYLPDVEFGSGDWTVDEPYSLIFGQYFHHVQFAVGIIDAVDWSASDKHEQVRRFELQAQCIRTRQLLLTDAAGFNGSDYEELKDKLAKKRSVLKGSAESQTNWALRGLYAERISGCNTWTSPSDEVD